MMWMRQAPLAEEDKLRAKLLEKKYMSSDSFFVFLLGRIISTWFYFFKLKPRLPAFCTPQIPQNMLAFPGPSPRFARLNFRYLQQLKARPQQDVPPWAVRISYPRGSQTGWLGPYSESRVVRRCMNFSKRLWPSKASRKESKHRCELRRLKSAATAASSRCRLWEENLHWSKSLQGGSGSWSSFGSHAEIKLEGSKAGSLRLFLSIFITKLVLSGRPIVFQVGLPSLSFAELTAQHMGFHRGGQDIRTVRCYAPRRT